MKQIFFIVTLILFSLSSLYAKTIKYAPLPMYKSELVLKQYQGIMEYLNQETGYDFEFVYHANYADLLDAIAEAKVDIAHLGPLPYASLLSRKNHNSKPIVQFLDSQGVATYTCSLITLAKNMPPMQETILEPVALTQPLSTCGFLSVAYLLQKYNLNLTDLKYHYSGTHSHVVLDILLGDAHIGGVRTSEYLAYKHLDLIQIDETPPFPGFLWVGSSALNDEARLKIQNALIKLDPFENSEDAILMHDWGSNVKYGSVKTDEQNYQEMSTILEKITIPELE